MPYGLKGPFGGRFAPAERDAIYAQRAERIRQYMPKGAFPAPKGAVCATSPFGRKHINICPKGPSLSPFGRHSEDCPKGATTKGPRRAYIGRRSKDCPKGAPEGVTLLVHALSLFCLMRSPKGRAHTAPLGAGKPKGLCPLGIYCVPQRVCPFGAREPKGSEARIAVCPKGALWHILFTLWAYIEKGQRAPTFDNICSEGPRCPLGIYCQRAISYPSGAPFGHILPPGTKVHAPLGPEGANQRGPKGLASLWVKWIIK